MIKREAANLSVDMEYVNKYPPSISLKWKPGEWMFQRAITDEVSIIAKRDNWAQLIVKKVVEVIPNSNNDMRPTEVRALLLLPDCNRIVKPLFCSLSEPDPKHSTILFEHYPLGDLVQWRAREFTKRNLKPVPESYIWRCFIHLGQALAFLHNQLGPDTTARQCLLHRDIKPSNVLVVDNGTTYPSFKLHDFGCAKIYQKDNARKPSYCGTFNWQPPENPIINTTAADLWALGACIHYLAVGHAPIEDFKAYGTARFNENDMDPKSAKLYNGADRYYAARVPRRVTPINLTREEQQLQGIGPWNHQYSEELNAWMLTCLQHTAKARPSAIWLISTMGPVAKVVLKHIGGIAAWVDLDAQYGATA